MYNDVHFVIATTPFRTSRKEKVVTTQNKIYSRILPSLNRSEFLTRIFTRNEAGFCLTGVLKKNLCIDFEIYSSSKKERKKKKKDSRLKKIFTHIQETKNLTRQTFRSSIRILDVVSRSIEASRGSTRTINFNPLSRM